MDDHNGTNQQFRLADSDSGYVRLINRNSNKAMEVQGASTADGGNIVQYDDWNGANQQWQLVRVGGGNRRHQPPTGTCTFRRRTGGRRRARWRSRGRVGSSLKDFTHAPYNGQQLVYATTHDTGRRWGSMNFGLFTNWSRDGLGQPEPDDVRALSRRRCSTSRRSNIWVLAYQWGGPAFSYRTSTDPSEPERLVGGADAVHREHLRFGYGSDRPGGDR